MRSGLMTIKVTADRYHSLKEKVEELAFVWQEYERQNPNDWYLFKYQGIMRYFLSHESSDYLYETVHHSRFSSKVKVPLSVYHELVELSTISYELQDVMAHPPYGSAALNSYEKTKG